MKTINYLLWIALCVALNSRPATAQSTEIQQLLLNAEKLTQLKNILSDMKQGFATLSNGYQAVKNISQGNFSIHELFIEGLKAVNPEIRKYPKVAAILRDQASLTSEYKAAFSRFKATGTFGAQDIDYLGRVYSQLLNQTARNLEELLTVLTASELRMSDAERLAAIDRLFDDGAEKLQFLRAFNKGTDILAAQRARQKKEQDGLRSLYQ